MAVDITIDDMVQQWVGAEVKFINNLNTFSVEIGKEAVKVFKGSFEKERLNTDGSNRWQERRSNIGRKANSRRRKILHKTGDLKNSISWKWQNNRKNSITIHSDKKYFRRGWTYAAIHNDPSGSHTYGGAKFGSVPTIQRQFIGHSSVLNKKFAEYSRLIFRGFPKKNRII